MRRVFLSLREINSVHLHKNNFSKRGIAMIRIKITSFFTWAALSVVAAQLITATTASAAGYKMADKVGAGIL